MTKIKRLGLLWIVMLIFTSCNNTVNGTSETLPGINIPADRINTSIKLLDAPELLNSHKNGELLSLAIINLSDTTIVFPEYYGVKLFTNEGGKWIEVHNDVQNSDGTFYLPTKDSWPLGLIVDTSPYILDLTTPTPVRIVIVGHKEDETEQVGAYIDVTINP